jgi:DNA (cytosine-5)-methyltransferase 1
MAKTTKNKKYKALDLFCGCGGISYGFEMAGYEIIGGIDFNKDATDTFKRNFPAATVVCTDITTISNEEIHNNYSGVDVIIGGPPCQGFSTANRHQKETDDPRNKLFFEYIRFVKELKPKFVLIENVRGILTRDNGYAKERITTLLKELNYELRMQVLDASDYGVPQCRKRAIMVGIRQDFLEQAFDFDRLKTSARTTVAEAISDLYGEEKDLLNKRRKQPKATCAYQEYLKEGSEYVYDHEIRYPADKVQERISHVPQGGNWQDVPEHLWPNNRKNRHSSAYKRLKEDSQSCTIDTGNAHSNYFHPLYNRIPSIRESARLQSFPDRFLFEGTRGSRYKQVGNAVPPLMAKAVADAIMQYFKDKR